MNLNKIKYWALGLCTAIIISGFTSAKIEIDKREQILTGKKWTVTEVKKRKNDFEIGEVFSFTADKKFIISKNDYTSAGGTWKLLGNKLILVFNTDKYGNNRKIPSKHKIIKLKDDKIILKYEYIEGTGKDKIKTKAKLYLM